jgi:hypothetical protein
VLEVPLLRTAGVHLNANQSAVRSVPIIEYCDDKVSPMLNPDLLHLIVA